MQTKYRKNEVKAKCMQISIAPESLHDARAAHKSRDLTKSHPNQLRKHSDAAQFTKQALIRQNPFSSVCILFMLMLLIQNNTLQTQTKNPLQNNPKTCLKGPKTIKTPSPWSLTMKDIVLAVYFKLTEPRMKNNATKPTKPNKSRKQTQRKQKTNP